MLGQVTIKTASPAVLKPLLRAAIQDEKKVVMHGIKRTKERLAGFEKQFGMTSEDFERRFEAGEIRETLDLIDWLGEMRMLRLLNEQETALEGATVR